MGRTIWETGSIFSLNYEPEIEEGFVSKIVVKLLECRDDYMKSVEIATADEFYRSSLCQEYELNKRHRFNEDYIQAIDDVFFYMNNSHPDLETEHSRFGKIRFRDCYFGIDVLDPPATPISRYSGDSVGAAMFLCLMSAFFNTNIHYDTAVTGSLRSKYSNEIGLVGDIIGKVKAIFRLGKESKILTLLIPDVDDLLKEEMINREDISDIIDEIGILESEREYGAPHIKKCRTLEDAFRHEHGWSHGGMKVLEDLGWLTPSELKSQKESFDKLEKEMHSKIIEGIVGNKP